MPSNGEAADITITAKKILTDSEKLDLIIQSQTDMQLDIQELKEAHAEVVEKLTNMELPWGDGFNTRDRFDS